MRIPGLLILLSLLCHVVGAQPVAPEASRFIQAEQVLVEAASAGGLSVDLGTRASARQFYRAVYFASEGVPLAWTGDYSTGSAGDTAQAFKDAVALRINWFRAMAGIPAAVSFNATYSAKAQKAAFMMSVNGALSHYPPSSWTYYSADGAEAAANSNLALGYCGPAAIDGLIHDSGANNAAVGHRRWFLYPQTQYMGSGDVPGSTTVGPYSPAQAVWVMDSLYGTTRPAVRDSFVAWPPMGHVPYSVVYPRWSFSYPGADFSAATVTVSKSGVSVPVSLEPVSTGYGENTLVFFVDGVLTGALPRPSSDVPYSVTISNAVVNGVARNFSYTVTVFDPDVAGSSESLVSVSGAGSVALGSSVPFSISAPAYAGVLQWRAFGVATQSTVFGAEGDLQGLLASTTGTYSARTTTAAKSGGASYHLAHPTAQLQTLLLPGVFHVPSGAAASLSFQSRLGYATVDQVARAQISTDEGISWGDLWSQAGSGSAGESSFVSRSVSLSAYAGRTVRIRFAYTHPGSGSYYYQTTDNVGWLVDDVSVSGASLVSELVAPQTASGGAFSLTPTGTGTVYVQARGLWAGTYPMEWGPASSVLVSQSVEPSRLANVSVRAVSKGSTNPLILGFVVSDGSNQMLIRGIGPSLKLAPHNVSAAVEDTVLNLFETVDSVPYLRATNDNWASGDVAALQAAFAKTWAFDLSTTSLDAALLTTVSGTRTAQAYDPSRQGVVLIEAYEVSSAGGGRLTNVSARNYAGVGQDVLVIGFIISGNAPIKLLIRGVGSELIARGVVDAITDPYIELFDANQAVLASNDNWDSSGTATLQAAFASTYAAPLTQGSRSSAMIITLNPGLYTAQLKGNGGATGSGLLEVFVMP